MFVVPFNGEKINKIFVKRQMKKKRVHENKVK